jgi:cold shock CspA family protein
MALSFLKPAAATCFVHIGAVQAAGPDYLDAGQKVSCDVIRQVSDADNGSANLVPTDPQSACSAYRPS